MSLSDDLYHIAQHIGDDQPNLPEGAKNTILLAAKALGENDAKLFRQDKEISMLSREVSRWRYALDMVGRAVKSHTDHCLEQNTYDKDYRAELDSAPSQPTKDKV